MRYHLVHVGKCTDESVIRAIRPQFRCLSVYHCGGAPAVLADLIRAESKSDVFIVLMCGPVARFVSAFEWDLHSQSLAGDGKAHKNAPWERLFRTFRSANALAEARTSPDAELHLAAQKTLSNSRLHIQFDLGWYLPQGIVASLPQGRTHLIWTERVEADVETFMLSQNWRFDGVSRTKDNYKHKLPPDRLTKELSALGRQNIMLVSRESYGALRELNARFGSTEQMALLAG